MFAKAAEGTIFYLGFGEEPKGIFPPKSFTAKHEFPFLMPEKVDRAVILVMHASGFNNGICMDAHMHN